MTRGPDARGAVRAVLDQARVVVTVGSGGVGKTTTAAILGLHAAHAGKRVLVMTVDPARRLANSLGLEGLGHDAKRVPLDDAPGELWATMLDMKRTFDGIVERYIDDADSRRAILDNRFYHHFSTGLAGAQELSASERLHEVVDSGAYDLVVLDTPPTANALDFLEAPVRFFDALDSSAVQWVIAATGLARGKGIAGVGTQFLLKTLGRFTGQEFFQELGEFLFHFSGLLDGIRDRSQATQRLLSDDATHFFIVTSPDPATVSDALSFRTKLTGFGVHTGAVIANRTHTSLAGNAYLEGPVNALADALGDALEPDVRLRVARALLRNAADFEQLALRDAATLERLDAAMGDIPVVSVPMYPTDVHSVSGLMRMRGDLLG